MFQQGREEEQSQWALPAEPFKRPESEVLDDVPSVDSLSLGLDLGSSVTSITIPPQS